MEPRDTQTGVVWDSVDLIVRDTVVISDFFKQTQAAFLISRLEPGELYRFYFDYVRQAPRGLTTVSEVVRDSISAETQASLAAHLDGDLGVLWARGAGYWGALTSLHVHAQPVESNLGWLWNTNEAFWNALFQRLSVFGGISVAEFDSHADVEKKFDGIGSPVFGLGFRVHEDIRVSWGMIFFEQKDPNPLVDRSVGRQDNFAAATVNLDYKAIFGPLLTLLGIK